MHSNYKSYLEELLIYLIHDYFNNMIWPSRLEENLKITLTILN